MERRTSTLDGNNPYNWVDNNGLEIDGTDADGNPINGTRRGSTAKTTLPGSASASPAGSTRRRWTLRRASGRQLSPGQPLRWERWYLWSAAVDLESFVGKAVEALGQPYDSGDCRILVVSLVREIDLPAPTPPPRPRSPPPLPPPPPRLVLARLRGLRRRRDLRPGDIPPGLGPLADPRPDRILLRRERRPSGQRRLRRGRNERGRRLPRGPRASGRPGT